MCDELVASTCLHESKQVLTRSARGIPPPVTPSPQEPVPSRHLRPSPAPPPFSLRVSTCAPRHRPTPGGSTSPQHRAAPGAVLARSTSGTGTATTLVGRNAFVACVAKPARSDRSARSCISYYISISLYSYAATATSVFGIPADSTLRRKSTRCCASGHRRVAVRLACARGLGHRSVDVPPNGDWRDGRGSRAPRRIDCGHNDDRGTRPYGRVPDGRAGGAADMRDGIRTARGRPAERTLCPRLRCPGGAAGDAGRHA